MNPTSDVVIVDGARTPVGSLMGALKDFPGADLGGIAIAAALTKTGAPTPATSGTSSWVKSSPQAPARTPPAKQHSPPGFHPP